MYDLICASPFFPADPGSLWCCSRDVSQWWQWTDPALCISVQHQAVWSVGAGTKTSAVGQDRVSTGYKNASSLAGTGNSIDREAIQKCNLLKQYHLPRYKIGLETTRIHNTLHRCCWGLRFSRTDFNLDVLHICIFSSPRKKPTDQFLRDALEARLRMLIPYIEKWPQV